MMFAFRYFLLRKIPLFQGYQRAIIMDGAALPA
jgi:hypothetical protein